MGRAHAQRGGEYGGGNDEGQCGQVQIAEHPGELACGMLDASQHVARRTSNGDGHTRGWNLQFFSSRSISATE